MLRPITTKALRSPSSTGQGSLTGAWGTVAAAWLVLAASASMAWGQDWKPEPVDLKGHSGDVVAVASVGDLLATAGSDGSAKVWDLADGKLTHRLNLVGHAGKVLAIALSTDRTLVATGGSDRTVRLWDAVKGTALATLQGHSGPVETVAFNPDGKTLASAGLDTSIRLWDIEKRQISRTIQGHEQGVRGLAFSPDGKLLASASRDRSVKLWDAVEGTEQATLGHHDAPAWCVAFAPDGKTLASGGLDKLVRLWRVGEGPATPGAAAGQPLDSDLSRPVPIRLLRPGLPAEVVVEPPPVAPIPAQLGGGMGGGFAATQPQVPPQPNQIRAWQAGADVVALAFAPEGMAVAAAVSDLAESRTTPGSVKFFNTTGLLLGIGATQFPAARTPIRGHLGPIWGLVFDRTGQSVATVGGDASVRLWNSLTAQPLAASIGRSQPEAIEERVMAHLDPVEALVIMPDGKRVATVSESAGVSLWDLSTRTLIGRLREPSGRVRVLAISPDGKILATGGDGKVISLRNAATAIPIDTLKGHLEAITTLAFSPDGKTLASGSKDASVTLWDVEKKAEIANLARHTSAVTTLAFSPDGSMLATAGLDFSVKLWELPNGRFVDSLDAHKEVVDALAFDPDGKTLASADRSGNVRLWDLAGRSERRSVQASSGPVRALGFAPDGKMLVGVGDDRSIRRWDVVDGKVTALRRDAHAGAILALGFGPGGEILATGGADRELKLWDVDARLAPGPFADLEGKVQQVAVSPDGKTLVTASADQFARIWDVATGRERIAPIPFGGAEARIAFSPDGKSLALLSVNTSGDPAKVWDVATGQMKAQAGANEGSGAAIAFAPDGKTWATTDGAAILVRDQEGVDAASGHMQATAKVRSLAFAPDGKGVAAGLADGSVERVDQQENPKDKKIFRSSNNSVDVLIYSPDSRSIAIGGTDRVVRVLDADTKAVRLALRGHRRPITSLAFSPDGKILASAADGEPTLFAWDVASGEVVSNPTLPDASGREGLGCLAFAPDGKALFAGGERGVTTFDMTEGNRPASHFARGGPRAGKERATLQGHSASVRSLAFVEGGSKLVTRSEDFVVKVWDLLDHNRDLHTFGGTEFKAQSMALRPDGKTLAVGLRLPDSRLKAAALDAPVGDAPPPQPPDAPAQKISDEVKFWDVDSGEGRGMINAKATNGGVDRVVALVYTRDGKTLATTSKSGIIRLWDADTLAPKGDLDARKKSADIVQFSPDGKTLLGADASGLVTLWDAETGHLRTSFSHEGGMNQVLLSPDGKLVATAGSNVPPPKPAGSGGGPASVPSISDLGPGAGGDVRLWDLATGRRVAVLPMASGKVTRIAFARDGKFLAASTTGAVATVWDVESAAPVVTLAWPSGEAKYLTFTPDGKALAVGGEDETLRIWDVPTGNLRADLLGHTDAINWVAFSPDGQTIATAGRDTTVKLWDMPKP